MFQRESELIDDGGRNRGFMARDAFDAVVGEVLGCRVGSHRLRGSDFNASAF